MEIDWKWKKVEVKANGGDPGVPKPVEPTPNGGNVKTIYITKQNLIDLGWNKSEKYLNDEVVDSLNKSLKKYGICQPEQIYHFLSQVMKESDNWNYKGVGDGVIEVGSEDYFTKNYEFRKDLGNISKGDGLLFRGSGYIHLTGRANYVAFYNHLLKEGINDLLILTKGYLRIADAYAWETATWFWSIRTKLNEISLIKGEVVTKTVIDNGKKVEAKGNSTIFEVTRKVNGGYNGIIDRISYYNLVKNTLDFDKEIR